MKKLLVVVLTIFSFVAISAHVNAESANIITDGDMEFLEDGQNLLTHGEAGFGSGNWDSNAVGAKDPLNENNMVLKLSYTTEDKAFSSFFKFCTVEANTTYDISFKYLVVGETDNFGMRFAGQTIVPEKTFYSGAATDGWQEASFQLTTVENGVYDSIGVWFNTKGSEANIGYMDDIVITKAVAEEPVNTIITYHDFEGMLNEGNDVHLGEGDNMLNGYGSLGWDSHVIITKDPVNAENTVAKFSYSEENKSFSSFFKFCTIEANATYTIDFDYLVVGTTDNFGMRFAPDVPKLETTFYSGNSTDGWQHASWEWTTNEYSTYDSIGVWFNTMGSADNAGYIDNIVIAKVGGTEEEKPAAPTITYGDFEGMLNEGADVNLGEGANMLNGYGSGSWDSYAIITKDPLNAENTVAKFSYSVDGKGFSSFFKFCTLKPSTTYTIEFDYLVVGETDNFGMRFAPDVPKLEYTFYEGSSTDGWQHASWEWTTDQYSTYDSIGVWFSTKGSADNVGYIDNIVITEVVNEDEPTPTPEPEIENPFKPGVTYYQSSSQTVNGDFEAFEVGTVFSEVQLEGAWGSVNLDNPASIQTVDGSKVLELTAGSKTYSSAFLMMPDTLEVGDLLRLTYDVKLVLSGDAASYTAIDTCLVGGSNISYYLVDFKSLDFDGENMTTGKELLSYPITVTPKANGWYTISFDYQVTSADLIQTNSLRFLFTAKSAEDHMYIDNVNLYYLSETEFDDSVAVESITFNDGSLVNMTAGTTKVLKYTINPEDATDTSVTFKSDNEAIATVDKYGKVTAVAAGTCKVTVTAANGVKAEIAIIISEEQAEQTPEQPEESKPEQPEESKPEESKKGCRGSVVASVFGLVALTGAVVVMRKRKEQ